MPFSLMNGISTMGAGIAAYAGQAGLESQKADLLQQQSILADHLATVRETGLQASGAGFAADAAAKAQAATAANVATTEAGATGRTAMTNTAEAARTAANNASQMAIEQARLGGDSDQMKLLRALGVLPPAGGQALAGSAAAAPSPAGGSSTAAPGASGTGTSSSAAASPSVSGTSTTGTGAATPPGGGGAAGAVSGTASATPGSPIAGARPDPIDNPMVRKLLGYPEAGSEDALRRAVAADVRIDPAFQGKTAGQQAIETENRVNVAKGTMTSPATQMANATLIASYQIKPPDGFALTRQGGAETMAMVAKLNPDYQESRFGEINDAMKRFGAGGVQGNTVRALDVGVQHLDVFDQAVSNLGNTNVQTVNAVKNAFARQFGSAAPTTLDGLKQIVATEVEKAVAGGIGSAGDRDRLIKSLDTANSPEQLLDMTAKFRALMAGQLDGLKRQYENDTGFTKGNFAFENKLGPATIAALGARSGSSSATATPAATTGSAATPRAVAPAGLWGQDDAGASAAFNAPAPAEAPSLLFAPANPDAREVGQTYLMENGKPGVWRSAGWEPGRASAAASGPPPGIAPSWVKLGDHYSASLGKARGADGTIYGPPQ